jgi:hypothetical protein
MKWATIRTYNAAPTCTWTPTYAAAYTLEVWARELGSTKNNDASRTMSYTIVPALSALKLAATPAAPVYVNTPVTLTASSAGGLNVEYKFVATGPSGQIVIRDFNSSPTCTWVPTLVRNYPVTVQARNAGSPKPYDAAVNMAYNVVAPLTKVSLTANLLSPRSLGTPVTLSAAKTGGGIVYYKFRVGRVANGSTTWTVLREYGTGTTCSWAPSAAGSYVLQVWAREAGRTSNYDVEGSINYVINPAISAVNFTTTPSSPARVNALVTLNASATGGTRVTYRFRVGYFSGSRIVWSTLSNVGGGPTCTWKPAIAKTNSIEVTASEANNPSYARITKSFTAVP